jgi:iron complex transport system ATP-binding protein
MSLVIESLYFAYEHRTASSGIWETATQGSLTALLVPNVSGKSTLLGCIVGALKPLKGRVLVDGKTSHAMKARKFSVQVAYVPQIANVSAPFTARDVIEFGRYTLPVDDSKNALNSLPIRAWEQRLLSC